ncbi:MAG: quinoprotein glucose dehydrogenase [Verrucomicrobiales bacterium]|jgi:quinoprotein glucose dehydrogenase
MTIPCPRACLCWLSSLLAHAAAENWPVYHGEKSASHYSALDHIDRSNITQLEPAWIFRTKRSGTLQCNPLIIDGRVFLFDQDLHLHALDGSNGKPLWEFSAPQAARGIVRGLCHREKHLFFAISHYLYAVHAETGKPINTFGQNGRIDLRDDLDTDPVRFSISLKTPGVIYKDLIIVGSNPGEGPQPTGPGHIRAYDTRTGERRWIFHTIPHPGEFGYETWSPDSWRKVGSANCWGGFSIDEARGLVIFGTGSPAYDHYGGNRIGQNLFSNCVMALRAETGEYVWHYQVVHHDLWDYDIPCQPNLVTVTHDGKKIDAVAQSTKMGHIFLLDRETGKPLFPVEERPVPASTIPGESSWPTQPFPVKPPAFAKQRFAKEDITDLNPKATEAVKAFIKSKNMLLGDVFIPPGIQPSVVMPQFNGGGEWGGAGYDPDSGLLYINASNEAEWQSMVHAKPTGDMTKGQLGLRLYQAICANCHGNGAVRPEESPALPSLATIKERLTSEQALTLLKTGRGQMPSFAALSDIERTSIVAYLYDEDTNANVPKEALTHSWADDIPYLNTGHHDFRDPDGYPVNKRPWGTLTAIDLNLGTLAWQVPLGTYPALEKQGLPPTGSFNIGGPLVTAGGLVFIGAAMDERFHAFDKATGELLWEFQMEAGGYASPATYAIEGRQFILIAAGGAGKPGTKAGNAYYAFALPKP